MNITKYSSFTDIMKNIFTSPKNNTHLFPPRKKKHILVSKRTIKAVFVILIQERLAHKNPKYTLRAVHASHVVIQSTHLNIYFLKATVHSAMETSRKGRVQPASWNSPSRSRTAG